MYTAIVTGGAQGIGKAITLKLIENNVYVFILDNDQEALSDFETEHQGLEMSKAIYCDVSQSDTLVKTLASITKQKASLKYLVNNAGVSRFKPMHELKLEEWNYILAVNLTSYFLTTKTVAENLGRNQGSVVNISSTRALMSEPHGEAYGASKGGVLSLTHALAISLQPRVRVNCISPGWIDVQPWQKRSRRKTTRWNDKHHLQHPAGRIGMPEDVAELTWYLLSDKGSFITGQNFVVDGGMTRKMIYEED